jgi:L-noviosyl transferase
MKVLVTSCPNQGHFYPMIPLLWALRSAGHHVVVAMPRTMAGVTASSGVTAVSLGDDVPLAELVPDHEHRPAQDDSVESLAAHVADYYGPLAERHVDRLFEIAERWQPDVLLHTSWEYAGPIVAARLGIPTVKHGWGLTLPPLVDATVHERLAPLYREWGLHDVPPPPVRWVDVCPRSLQTGKPEAESLPMSWIPFNGSTVLPDWLLTKPDHKRICVTLGNVPIRGKHSEVLHTTLEALQDIDAEVVIAAGWGLDHDADLPPNVRVVRGIPLHDLLPTCDLVINHGGAGSVLASIAHGLPQVVLPQMCVHFQHGDRLASVGGGVSLHPAEATVENIREAVCGLLTHSAARIVAARLRQENDDQLSPASVVRHLETVVVWGNEWAAA